MTTSTTPPASTEPASPLDPELAPAIRSALKHGHTIDITTIGRRTGEPRRIEMMFHSFDGHVYISGMPNPDRSRAWLQNLRANPNFTFHLKRLVRADLPATAREITEPVERRAVIEQVARAWRRDPDVMFAHSPLVEVTIPGFAPVVAAPAP
jgi:deazaflavin-dependent oxidoreductase (nitroreductase family)